MYKISGSWRSGSAFASHAKGHRFKSCTAHHLENTPGTRGYFFAVYKERSRIKTLRDDLYNVLVVCRHTGGFLSGICRFPVKCYNKLMAYVYILTNASNTVLYIGVTNNLIRRVYEHKQHFVPGFSARYHLNKLVYYEVVESITVAIKREKVLKEWQRKWKDFLISKMNPTWKDLYPTL